jgi:hypothetical protein
MKMIVIAKADGTIVGAMPAKTTVPQGVMHGGLMPGPGEKMHEIDVPDEFSKIIDGEKLHERIKAHIAKTP